MAVIQRWPLAQIWLYLRRGERYWEEAHEDVGDGEVGHEEIGRVLHRLLLQDDERHEDVAERADDEDDRVEKSTAWMDSQQC